MPATEQVLLSAAGGRWWSAGGGEGEKREWLFGPGSAMNLASNPNRGLREQDPERRDDGAEEVRDDRRECRKHRDRDAQQNDRLAWGRHGCSGQIIDQERLPAAVPYRVESS